MAEEMSFFAKLRLLAEWSPVLGQVQVIMAADDPHDQAVAVIDALQFAAGKTPTEIDDEALEHLESILKSEEGTAFFRWLVETIKGAE
jgi:hypothetical protein